MIYGYYNSGKSSLYDCLSTIYKFQDGNFKIEDDLSMHLLREDLGGRVFGAREAAVTPAIIFLFDSEKGESEHFDITY